uniref:Uncharacterized protein n=1 Tax=Noctiluca scintillans TaxID=2966 RepID=A0A7S1ABD8_NOCSC|mmetsp:Transcript_3943/g.10947  ORF Transcript_3943/g.10947 Transcript_3943/m.10947 type:complete len:557 (+) Transcript_3943:105-1775(+)
MSSSFHDLVDEGDVTGTRICFENRLPVSLRLCNGGLLEGCWRVPPPSCLGARSVVKWIAAANGVLGRHGAAGEMRYSCEWKGRRVLHIRFTCSLFGVRKLECREEGASTDEARLQIDTDMGSRETGGVMKVTIELREQLAHHVKLEPHRLPTPTTIPSSLNNGRLAGLLLQATRSALVRIVNLSQHALILTTDIRREFSRGFWITRPSERIAPLCYHDFGIAGHGWLSGTRGWVKYQIEAPRNDQERQFRLEVSWASPWVGPCRVRAEPTVDVFTTETHSNWEHNQVSSVHLIDRRNLPELQVLDSLALVNQSLGEEPRSGSQLTKVVQEQMASRYELRISSVRAFLGQGAANKHNGYMEPGASLEILYRIGPQVFTQTFGPNEPIHISSAVPGGTGHTDTILAAVEAQVSNSTATDQAMPNAERALQIQRQFTAALTLSVHTKLVSAFGTDYLHYTNVSSAHQWQPLAKKGGSSSTDALPEFDAHALLKLLRHYWTVLGNGSEMSVLDPLEKLDVKWQAQDDVDKATLANAEFAMLSLIKTMGLDAEGLRRHDWR